MEQERTTSEDPTQERDRAVSAERDAREGRGAHNRLGFRDVDEDVSVDETPGEPATRDPEASDDVPEAGGG